MNKIRNIVRSSIIATTTVISAGIGLAGISGCGAVAPNWDNQHQAYKACEERVARFQENGGGAIGYRIVTDSAGQLQCEILPNQPQDPQMSGGDCGQVGCTCDPRKTNACQSGNTCSTLKGRGEITICLLENNRSCRVHADCKSAFCDFLGTPSTCKGIHGDTCQSDVNCAERFGLSCTADMAGTKRCLIKDGGSCSFGADCASGECDYHTKRCVAPSCGDGRSNGTETGLDCGGPTCNKCANGQRCVAATDCQSNVCTNGKCGAAPTCTDGIKNGAETDVDCGGGTCAKCDIGQNCGRPEDCKSNLCSGEPGKEKCANP